MHVLTRAVIACTAATVVTAAEVGVPPGGSNPVPPAATITLPAQYDLEKLTDLICRFTGIMLHYPSQKVTGNVHLAVSGPVDAATAWRVYNQALVAQGMTTVIVGSPPIYQIVPLAEAGNLTPYMSAADVAALPFPPGYVALVVPLEHLGADAAVKALGTIAGAQTSQVHAFGGSDRAILVSAPRERAEEIARMVLRLDVPGSMPAVRFIRPTRISPTSLQTSLAAAWNALGRAGDHPVPAEIQIAPDGVQVALITNQDALDRLVALAADLDRAEPVEQRTYRPRAYSIDDVAGLLHQVMTANDGPGVTVVKNRLTSSLLITATAAQHARITDLLRTLDEAPPSARRQMKAFPIKHRAVDDVAKVLSTLLSLGGDSTDAGSAPPATAAGGAATPPPDAPPLPNLAPTAPAVSLNAGPAAPNAPAAGGSTVRGTSRLAITTDATTNRLIVLGDPDAIAQVGQLLTELDTAQPQVQLTVTLVTLSATQSRTLGTELAHSFQSGSVSGNVASLFGLSTAAAGDPIARIPTGANGLSGIVLNPGDFAMVIQALEHVGDGRTVIRSQVVTNNNTKATINGVVQQPLTAINSNSTVATTSVTGTTDAGTQITVTPAISPADHVTLTFSISQSAFLGASTTTKDGTVIPPAKTADAIASVATIPDGFTIAVGGLSNRSSSTDQQRVPFLGAIPLLGYLFRTETTSHDESRFFVLIRAEIMRNVRFEDLRLTTDAVRHEAGLAPDHPVLTPRLIP